MQSLSPVRVNHNGVHARKKRPNRKLPAFPGLEKSRSLDQFQARSERETIRDTPDDLSPPADFGLPRGSLSPVSPQRSQPHSIHELIERVTTPASLPTTDTMEPPQAADVVEAWCMSYMTEEKCFKSMNLFAEMRLREALAMLDDSRGLTDSSHPQPERAAICCDLLYKVTSIFGRYESLVKLLIDEVMCFVYSDFTDKSSNEVIEPGSPMRRKASVNARLFYDCTPYFTLHENLVRKFKALEEEVEEYEGSLKIKSHMDDGHSVLFDPQKRMIRTFIFNLWKRHSQQRRQEMSRHRRKHLRKWFALWRINLHQKDSHNMLEAAQAQIESMMLQDLHTESSVADVTVMVANKERPIFANRTTKKLGEVFTKDQAVLFRLGTKVLPGICKEQTSDSSWLIDPFRGDDVEVEVQDMQSLMKENLIEALKDATEPDHMRALADALNWVATGTTLFASSSTQTTEAWSGGEGKS